MTRAGRPAGAPGSTRWSEILAVAGRSVCQFSRIVLPSRASDGADKKGPRTIRTPLAAPTSTHAAGVAGTTVLRPGEAKTATASRLPSVLNAGNDGDGRGTVIRSISLPLR